MPQCTACLFSKATRRPPWISKGAGSQSKIKVATKPWQVVSVDQLESPTPGLFAQLKGIPTRRQYKAVTIFVDHYSCLLHCHLQETHTSADTLKDKHAFEQFCGTHGVQVQHYHADNGRFADNAFINDMFLQKQEITYRGVNVHFQNGVAEKQIRDLKELTRTSLLHATAHWPKAISVHLWPYAIRPANKVLCTCNKRADGKSVLEFFAGLDARAKMDIFRPFGCPIYAFNNHLQARQRIPKWHKRAQLGIYFRPFTNTCQIGGTSTEPTDRFSVPSVSH